MDYQGASIENIYTDLDNRGRGGNIYLDLHNEKVRLEISLYGGTIIRNENDFGHLRNLNLSNSTLKQIHFIEGVYVFIELNGVFIHMFQEIEDLERMAFYNCIKIIYLNDLEALEELGEELKESEIMTFV